MDAEKPRVIKVECLGANPNDFLGKPINVSVRITDQGENMVGCPYAHKQYWCYDLAEPNVVYCQASREGLVPVTQELNIAAAEAFAAPIYTGQPEDPPPGSVLAKINLKQRIDRKFPRCIHKYPK